MRPIISFIGGSDSGKTTLLASLIGELKRRGYRLAVIKHTGDDFELDRAGKDSWRLGQAGSEAVAVSSPHRLAVIHSVERDLGPKEVVRAIGGDYDLILTEGFKQGGTPKIEVHRRGQGKELLASPPQLLAVVTDEPLEVDIPQFAHDEVGGLADLIEEWLRSRPGEDDIELMVNGDFVPVNPFVRTMLSRTLAAMISCLKGVKEVKSLRVWLRRKT